MLEELLEQGRTYREVASGLGVCHTTVERQIKTLLWSVARRSPIPGVPDLDLASLAQLRFHAEAVMTAVRAAPQRNEPQPIADLDEEELLGGIRRIRRLSENANRDVALVLTLLCTGAKPLEIARLKVRDYVGEDGSARRETCLAEGTALHGRERPIYFDSDRTCQAVDAYLEERVRRQIGVNARASFRGLDPDSPLFLTAKGLPFRIRARSAQDERLSCPVLLETYAGIFRRAGWPGVNTQYVRRLYAQRLAGKGADKEQLAELLGVANDRSVKRLLERRQRPLSDLVKELV